MADGTILHADLDSFFAAVEQRDHPHLLGKPVAVGGGVVMAASCEAKAFGVKSGMGGWEAKRLCPGLITVIEFLHPLPVDALWGVGKVTASKLHARGLLTVAQVAELSEETLAGLVGKAMGRQLHALANGRDARRVTIGVRRRSVGGQRALGRRGPKTPAALDATLVALVDRIGRRLRAARRVRRTVILRLRFDDFSRATRSHTLAEPTADTRPILAAVRALLHGVMPTIEREGVTLLGISLTNLVDAEAVQLALPLLPD